jgi:hypothetical protein
MVLYMCKQEMDKLVTLWDLHRFDCHDGGVIIEQSSGSGIGVATVATCKCGKEMDVTDYNRW